jgi:uncharacterized lipoprotein YehR (DUF1307 family)
MNIWKHRCDTIHNNTENKIKQTLDELTPKAQAIYALQEKLDAIDKNVFYQSQSTTLNMPIAKIKDWIKRTGNFVQMGVKRAQTRLKQHNHAITSFFLPKPRSQPHLPRNPNQEAQD